MKKTVLSIAVLAFLAATASARASGSQTTMRCPDVSKVEVAKEVTFNHLPIRGLVFGAVATVTGPVTITCEGDRMTIEGTGTASLKGDVIVYREE